MRGSSGRIRLLLLLGVLAAIGLAVLFWSRGGDPASTAPATRGGVSEAGGPELAGRAGDRPTSYGVQIHVPSGEEIPWRLQAWHANGWALGRDGTGNARLELEGLPAGPVYFRLATEDPGYLPLEKEVDLSRSLVDELALVLLEACRMVGRVTAGGGGVAGATVECGSTPPSRPPWVGEAFAERPSVLRTLTERSGEYRIEGLPHVIEGMQVRHADYVRVLTHERITGSPGDTVRRDFDLKPGFRVRGRVLDVEGDPFAGARIHVLREERAGIFDVDCWVEAGPDGRFLSPNMAAALSYELRIGIRAQEGALLLQHPVPGPHETVTDVGDLRPRGTRLRFVLPADRPDRVFSALASVVGEWAGEPASQRPY